MSLEVTKQALTTELTPLRHIPSILIRQRYYTTHFYFDNKLLIKQKSLIRKTIYILLHDEKIFIKVIRQLYNFTNLIRVCVYASSG